MRMSKPRITIIGSSNTDMVVKADHLPVPGETILGGTFFMNAGGKGANQAVAVARLGGNATFICKTGNDIFGRQSIQLFKEEGIDTSCLVSDSDNPSGVALISVDKQGENCIVVASGANATLKPADIETSLEIIMGSSQIMMQLEIPVATVAYIAEKAFKKNIPVILNPAPACALPDEVLNYVDIITPNETEAEMLSGIKVFDTESAKAAAKKIRDRGVKTVIITLGSKGALVLHEDKYSIIPTQEVDAVDTTAAGDVFNGALVVALSEGLDILKATAFGCMAASLSVTRSGAQASIPRKIELEDFIMKKNQHVHS
jgi:ribokinase